VLDIAGDYTRFLRRFRGYLSAEDQARLDGLSADRRTTGSATFDTLSDLANALQKLRLPPSAVADEDQVIIERIYRSAAHLRTIVRGLAADAAQDSRIWRSTRTELYGLEAEIAASSLGPQERAIVRKMWEMGTEKVVMQSVIQLDGDVITRIQRDRLGPEHATLHGLHQQGVKVSIETWQLLVQTIGALVSGLASFFRGLLRA